MRPHIGCIMSTLQTASDETVLANTVVCIYNLTLESSAISDLLLQKGFSILAAMKRMIKAVRVPRILRENCIAVTCNFAILGMMGLEVDDMLPAIVKCLETTQDEINIVTMLSMFNTTYCNSGDGVQVLYCIILLFY